MGLESNTYADSSGDSSPVGLRLRELRRGKKLTQRGLAAICGLSPGYIALMETGQRAADDSVLLRICEALSTDISAVVSTSPIKRVESMLTNAVGDLGASSCLFYVPDPCWPNELRLVGMAGVKIQEPMYGFVSPEGTRRVLLQGDSDFCSDTLLSTTRRDTLLKLPNTIPPSHRKLFSDFVEREGVRASARQFVRKEGRVEGVLFVNFEAPIESHDEIDRKLEQLRDVLSVEIASIINFLKLEDAPILQQAISLLGPTHQWLAEIGRQEENFTEYLESLLDSAMTFVGMDTEEGIGTIHLYRPESEDLVLVAHRGEIARDCSKIQSVVHGEGIISWVALRQRAIVISDLPQSEFKVIHVPMRDGIRSEIAVPLLSGKVLMGVLNLESTNPGRFHSQHVRALWYSASNAAVAAHVNCQAVSSKRLDEMNERLLDHFSQWVSTEESQRKAIAALAGIAGDCLEATRCDIWCFDPASPQEFRSLGSSYELNPEGRPRKGGWSAYICRTRRAAWINNILAANRLEVSFWNELLRSWETTAPRPGTPETVNYRVLQLGVGSELGMPIIIDQECLGIAWLKFDARSRPDHDEMLLTSRFAKSVGRVLRSFPR